MPTIQEVTNDPEFQTLPFEERRKVFNTLDKDFVGLIPEEQNKVLNHFSSKQPEERKIPTRRPLSTGTWEDEPSMLRKAGNVARDIGASVLNPEVGGSILKSIPNIPQSGMNYVKNMASAFMPKKESYYIPGGEVARGMGNLAIGGVEKLIPGEQGKEKYADAAGKFYKDRYGGGENIKNTFINDPVGFVADVSTLLSLGGTGASAAGRLLKPTVKSTAVMPAAANIPQGSTPQMSTLERIGSEMKQVGRAIEPTNLAVKAVTPPIKIAGSIASQIWGRLLTGAGSEAIETAFKGNPDFVDAMRGNIPRENVIGNAKDALNKMNMDRSFKYQQALEKIPNTKPLDITPIRSHFIDMLNRFKIKYDQNTGGLDFTRSRIIKGSEQADLNEIFNVVKDWGSKPDDLLPKNVDTLKQILGEYYSDSNNIRAIVSSTYNKARRVLVDNVPGYEKMVGDYETSIKTTNEIKKALSLSDRAMADTALRKLMSTMRENFEFRRDLLKQLEDTSGKDLSGQIAGLTMQSYIPKGLIGKGVDIGLLSGLLFAHTFSPTIGAVLLSSSPRVAGEFLLYFGKMARGINKVGQNRIVSNPAIRQGAYQAGRISNIENQPEWNKKPQY